MSSSVTKPLNHIALFAATRWEQRAARAALDRVAVATTSSPLMVSRRHGCRLTLVRGGIGMEKTTQAARELLKVDRSDLVLSVGFACALTAAKPGELLIGTETLLPDARGRVSELSRVLCTAHVVEVAVQAAKAAGIPARTGPILTVREVIGRATEKRAASGATGAIGLDMESAALGVVAMEQGAAFLVARTVSDLLDEDLPLDFNLFLRPFGWARTAVGLLRPGSMAGLVRLKHQATLASQQLTAFLERFLVDLLPSQAGGSWIRL